MSFDEWFNQQQPIRAENEYLQTDVVQIYREAKRAYEAGRADELERCIQAVESLKTCSCDSAGYVSEVVEYDNAKYDNAIEAIKAE